MPVLPKLKQPYLWPLGLLIVTNGLILAHAPPGLRYIAALVLLIFLPGWVWLQALFPPPADLAERLTLSVGLSLALTIIAAMFAVYLPGSLTAGQLLLVTNVHIIAGLAVIWRRQLAVSGSPAATPAPSPAQQGSLLVLIALLLLAAALRLPHLGYAEFHEDEAEALMLGTRLFQGEDYALFLHRKGPAQMLAPVAFWLLTGRINEILARFPFALSSILSVVTLFLIGRRWFNWQAGAIAALLWAVNGYAIGFGRMVQYQALIFFLGPLAIYCLYLAWEYHQSCLSRSKFQASSGLQSAFWPLDCGPARAKLDLLRLQILAAILLATCLLAHFDALLWLPAAGYLGWRIIKRLKDEGGGMKDKNIVLRLRCLLRSPLFIVIFALILFLALIASFYIPYLLDPEFDNTVAYLSESRVKPGLLYNNLALLQRLDKDYSSHFYLPVLALGIISFVVWQSVRLSEKWRWVVAGLGLLLASTWWLPDLWQLGSLSLTVLPWLLLGLICIRFSGKSEVRVAWIMFGAAFIGYVFLVDDPRTHLYIIYPGATLLAGAGWAAFMNQWTRKRVDDSLSPRRFHYFSVPLLIIVGLLVVGAIVIYDVAIFLQTESTLTHLRRQWDTSSWQIVYDDLPKERSYFGYPKREGWKAIGALRAQGKFPGDFRSMNEDFIVPIWYNYGQARSCYNTPAHFFIRSTGDDVPITAERYAETGRIQREGEVRLRIFSAGAEPQAIPPLYLLESFEDVFDQQTTPRQFAQQSEPVRWVGTQFGSAIKFVGYDLPVTTVVPGDTLYIDLYWQALENPGVLPGLRSSDGWRQAVGPTGRQSSLPFAHLHLASGAAGDRPISPAHRPPNPAGSLSSDYRPV